MYDQCYIPVTMYNRVVVYSCIVTLLCIATCKVKKLCYVILFCAVIIYRYEVHFTIHNIPHELMNINDTRSEALLSRQHD
jgi:hypothetical protein